MRALPLLTASTLLAGVAVVVPVVSVGATPHRVEPTVKVVRMPAGSPFVSGKPRGRVAPSPSATPAPTGDGSAAADAEGTQSVLARATDGADVVGVSFPDSGTARSAEVSVRTRVGRTWGPWTTAEPSDGAPDPGSSEAQRSKPTSEPVGVTGSDEVQVRVRSASGARMDRLSATFVDAGTSDADTALGAGPAASAGAAVARPDIISRAQWGADESLRNCATKTVTKTTGAVVHHTVNANSYTASQAASIVRGIYAYHTTSNGWCDIGYNYLVDRFGRSYEGRVGTGDHDVVGAHAAGFNSQTVGVASIGTHQSTVTGASTPSSDVLGAIGRVIGWRASSNGWDPASSGSFTSAGNSKYAAGKVVTKPRVSGHRDFNETSCPGDLAYSALAGIRSTASSLYRGGGSTASTTSTPAPTAAAAPAPTAAPAP
ncbi:MAG: N-acetylmuramoyl-L-alanine amidase, partial [Ornithinibacter sp.]